MASAPEADDKYSQAYLPDFCAAGTILVILLVAELVAIAPDACIVRARYLFNRTVEDVDVRAVACIARDSSDVPHTPHGLRSRAIRRPSLSALCYLR